MTYDIIKQRRTIRKYAQKPVPKKILESCVDAARLSPSGLNCQPLKYCIVGELNLVREVFDTVKWAGYLPEYGPTVKEMPVAYIVILLDKKIRANCGHDAGIEAMSISIVAFSEGLGSCIMGDIERPKLKEILNVPASLDIVLAVALGYPAEDPVVDKVIDGNIRDWLDENQVLHVPKRSTEEILHWNGYQ